jgi:pyruvate dehydrogenase E2 component (dihydrolipoamide acetyltransferase)
MTNDGWVVTMPRLGETVTEGSIGAWFKQVGETVAFDDPLFEVSTDKVDSEIPSPYDGVILEILVPAGETVPVGTPLVKIGPPGAELTPSKTDSPAVGGSEGPATMPAAAAPPPAAAPTADEAPPATATPPAGAPVQRTGGNGTGGPLLSPVVRRMAAEHGLDLAAVQGSGRSGRIRREDVEQAIAGGGAHSASATPAAETPAAAGTPAVAAAPAPAAAPPAAAPAAAAPAAGAPAGTSTAPAATSTDPRDEVVPLSRIRVLTADLMVRSLNTSAHVWTSVEVDFEAVEQVRRRHKDRFRKETGASLSYLPFICRATCDALRAFPAVNSSVDIAAKTMTLHPYVHLGIAVDLEEQGLVVPVVKDADSLNIRGVATKITTLAAAARSRKLSMGDMSGSTFTITNPGPFASYASFPIINQPNVAILCTDGVKRRPVAVGDAIAVHPVGIIGLVYDHRAFDGSTASKFLMHLRDSLEQRDWEAEVS